MNILSDIRSETVSSIGQVITSKIKELLEQKHLYQSVHVDFLVLTQSLLDDFKASSEILIKSNKSTTIPHLRQRHDAQSIMNKAAIEASQTIIKENLNTIQFSFWSFYTESNRMEGAIVGDVNPPPILKLPTVMINCKRCNNVLLPHNSGYQNLNDRFASVNFMMTKNRTQIPCQTFLFPYQCQACKEEPLVFLVRREGNKLTLCGRNHFESVIVSDTIPKQESKFYSDAITAYNTGNILAGTFMLRTTIEQYMRRTLGNYEKTSGDILSDQYSKLLDDEFPKKYTSLKTVYEELSIKIHKAEKDPEQFEKSLKDINRHFELLKHFPLK